MIQMMKRKRIAIVGAGISGLILGRELKALNPIQIEKSRSVGGRLATRRAEGGHFNHGLSLYDPQGLGSLHEEWRKNSLVEPFDPGVLLRVPEAPTASWMSADAGPITQLAKSFAKDLIIEFDCQLEQIERISSGWRLQMKKKTNSMDRSEFLECEALVLTAPLQQSLQILRQSQIESAFHPDRHSHQAAILLLSFCRDESLRQFEKLRELGLPSVFDHLEIDQRTKAVKICLSAEESRRNFDRDDSLISEIFVQGLAQAGLNQLEVNAIVSKGQIKKWRYSVPTDFSVAKQIGDSRGGFSAQPWGPFAVVTKEPLLLLVGDAFGESQKQHPLARAVSSAIAGAEFLRRHL